MNGKRLCTLGFLVASILAFVSARADEGETPAPSGGDTPAAAPAAEEAKKPFKQRWKEYWGPFALYLETGVGTGSTDTIESSMSTSGGPGSINVTDIDLLTGYFAVGWTLPYGKGQYLLSMTAHSENGYQFSGVSTDRRVKTSGGTELSPVDIAWWQVQVNDGDLRAQKNEYFWTDQDGDDEVEEAEIVQTPTLSLSRQVPGDLENRTQAWDLLYQRDFSYGKGRITGRWSAGARYFLYKGNILAAGYVTQSSTVGQGYTDGVLYGLIPISQETTGLGPTGSGEVQFHFARDRFVLFLRGRVSFVISSIKPDSGPFVTYAVTEGNLFPSDSRISDDISKSAWQLGAETGFYARLAPGLNLVLNASLVSYQDSVGVPATLNVPATATQIDIPASAVFVTRDLQFLSATLGLSYQF